MSLIALFLAAASPQTPVPPLLRPDHARPLPTPPAEAPAPKLIVVISVDQFSADLFAEYRNHFTGGFTRLLDGAVFPSAYQSHAATETCPGHSTILTGMRPARTGIIANKWVDQSIGRADKVVYCAEDERVPGSTSSNYTASDRHLRVPTLGEMMKAVTPATRVVSVSGKDRAAIMMGGHRVDELWWWKSDRFVSYDGRAAPAAVSAINADVTGRLAAPQPAMPLSPYCTSKLRAVATPGDGPVVGTGRFARPGGKDAAAAFGASPELDDATLTLAGDLARSMKLGRGQTTDLLIIGASATDYVGHSYGTQGPEMCLQLARLDQDLGKLFALLDRQAPDYLVVLTADHGGRDLPERDDQHAIPEEAREDPGLVAKAMGAAIGRDLTLPGAVLRGAEDRGDVWVDAVLSPAQAQVALAEAMRRYRAHPQVAGVWTRAELAAAPMPSGPPETWSVLDRARASFDAERSGDFVFLLRPRVMAAPLAAKGYVATHGSPWDMDRRVPLLFWRRGMVPFEQPLSVETVDIAPTLAGVLRLPVRGLDGRCLDLDAGPGSTCPR